MTTVEVQMPEPPTFAGSVSVDGEWRTCYRINRRDGVQSIMGIVQREPVDIVIDYDGGTIELHAATWTHAAGDTSRLIFQAAR